MRSNSSTSEEARCSRVLAQLVDRRSRNFPRLLSEPRLGTDSSIHRSFQPLTARYPSRPEIFVNTPFIEDEYDQSRTKGTQVNLNHCNACRSHIECVEEVETWTSRGSDVEEVLDRSVVEGCCRECREALLKRVNLEEPRVKARCRRYSGPGEMGECQRRARNTVDKAKSDGRCNVKRSRQRERMVDVHGHGDGSIENSNPEIPRVQGYKKTRCSALKVYSQSVHDSAQYYVTMFLTIFLYVFLTTWDFPEKVRTEYLLPILQFYLFPYLPKTVDTEEITSFSERCVDDLFCVTYSRFSYSPTNIFKL